MSAMATDEKNGQPKLPVFYYNCRTCTGIMEED